MLIRYPGIQTAETVLTSNSSFVSFASVVVIAATAVAAVVAAAAAVVTAAAGVLDGEEIGVLNCGVSTFAGLNGDAFSFFDSSLAFVTVAGGVIGGGGGVEGKSTSTWIS